MTKLLFRVVLVTSVGLLLTLPLAAQNKKNNPRVILSTNMGEIELELYPARAPVSVKNFFSYVRSGFYDGTIFHRVISGFMIQGGGYDINLNKKTTMSPIVNEAGNGLKNYRGTIVYARTNVVNSATSQFFINLVDNHFLDHKNNTPSGFGYAVFGKVIRGMKAVDKIGTVKTGIKKGMRDVPLKPVVILSAKIVGEKKK